jgi:hypothetical protein
MAPDFTVVLRGYERKQVDPALARAFAALDAGGDATERANARNELRAAKFEVALRGYDRGQVDSVVEALLRELDHMASSDEFRLTLVSVLGLPQPTDQQIVDEVRRLRELADRNNG